MPASAADAYRNSAGAAAAGAAGRWWERPRFWLAVMVVAFFCVSVYSGIVSYDNLQTANSTDAGIITQAVASTTHGHVAPFYESFDCEVKARCSFFLVHPSFVLYPAVPFYALVPSTVTLFALRSGLVALSAVPLYWLTRQVSKSPAKALLASGLFLLWAPTYLGDAFSLHLESLLPLELFTLAALWQSGRYRLGLVVALLMFLTFEIYPLFSFLLGAFFLAPYVARPIRSEWDRWRSGTPGRPLRMTIALGWQFARNSWRERPVRYGLVLMGSSVAAYILLALFINVLGAHLLGVAPPTVAPGITGIFTNPSSPATQSLSTLFTSPQTRDTAEFWLVLYALVAFIPLLSPRALILSVPWIGWTFLTDSDRFTTIGHQYGMIAAAPIFVGLAYGLQRVPLGRSSPGPAGAPTPPGTAAGRPGTVRFARRWRRPTPRTAWIGVLAALCVANGLLAPINPILPDLGVKLGTPFQPLYFDHGLVISSSFQYVEQLVAVIPHAATVLVGSPAYPLFANFPHAYVIGPRSLANTSNLPFNVSAGPEYAVLTEAALLTLAENTSRNISDPSLYGMRGYVGSTSQGPLLLYEKGYTGPAQLFGPPVPALLATFDAQSGLKPGARGAVAPDPSSPSGTVIESLNATNRTGLVWTGPNEFVSPGNYTLSVRVMMTGSNLSLEPKAHALRISVTGFGGNPVDETYNASNFPPGQWVSLAINFSLTEPLPSANVEGFLGEDQFSVAVAFVAIQPSVG
ncbi:MAG: DUF2079 domain-containing protein [Thermoplasmata archaeon]